MKEQNRPSVKEVAEKLRGIRHRLDAAWLSGKYDMPAPAELEAAAALIEAQDKDIQYLKSEWQKYRLALNQIAHPSSYNLTGLTLETAQHIAMDTLNIATAHTDTLVRLEDSHA